MAVLVDTSAWIEFFKPQGRARVKGAMTAALEEGIVVTVAPILVELLVGLDPARRLDSRAIERLRDLELVGLSWNACELAGTFGRVLARRGRRVPTVDLLMAGAAATTGHEIWHIGDRHFGWIKQAGGPPERDLSVGPS